MQIEVIAGQRDVVASVGDKPEMAGVSTVKLWLLRALSPFAATAIGPVGAPNGTVISSDDSVAELTCA